MIKYILGNIVKIFRERDYIGMAGVLFLGFIVYMLINAFTDKVITFVMLRKECRYTISTRNEYKGRGATGGGRYYYEVGGKVYTVTGARMDAGDHYFIKYYPPNPDRSRMTGIKANANDIKNLPPEGYKELPHRDE